MMSVEIINEDELDKYLMIGRLIHYEGSEELINLYVMTGEIPKSDDNQLHVTREHKQNQ